MLVSVIITNYNGERFLKKCLDSVLNTNYPHFEVIVVDNGSIDGSVELLSNYKSNSKIKTVLNKNNLGYADGNNAGIKVATGDYLVFLNNDTTVEPDWLSALVEVASSSLVGAAQSRLLLMDSPSRLDCAGNFSDYYGGTFARGLGEKDIGKYQFGEIFTCKGASMIMPRKIIKEIGIFDSDLFAYYEDTDLCWRVRLAGYTIFYVPKSIVYHKGSGSIPLNGTESFFFQVYLMKRNRIATLLKNYEIKNVMRYVLPLLVYEFSRIVIVGIDNLLKGEKASYSNQASKAILWNLKHFQKTWKKRVVVQGLIRRVSDREIMRQMRAPNQSQ